MNKSDEKRKEHFEAYNEGLKRTKFTGKTVTYWKKGVPTNTHEESVVHHEFPIT